MGDVPRDRSDVLVVGIGNEARGDDGVGPYVVREVAARAGRHVDAVILGDDPMRLLDLSAGRARVVVVDAGVTGEPAGTVVRLDPGAAAVLSSARAASTHALRIDVVLPIGIAVGRLPAATEIWMVEASRFDPGAPLDPRVRDGCDRLAASIVTSVAATATERDP